MGTWVGFGILRAFVVCHFRRGTGAISQAVAFASDLDQLGMVQEAVEDRCGGRDIADQFASVFQGSVGSHHG